MNNNAASLHMDEINVPEKMNIFQRLGNLFVNPKKLFSYTAKKPTIAFPVILLCVVSLLTQLLLLEPYKDNLMDTMHSTYKTMGLEYSVEQLESLANMTAIGTTISTPFIMVGTWLITTLILYLVFRLAGCEKGLKKYFSVVAYISLISAIGQLLHGLYIFFTGDSLLSAQVTSLASLINAETSGYFIYGIASNIEVFNIWTYVLYGIGFIYAGGAKKKRAYILSAALFVIVTLITAGIATVSSNLAGL